jgi:hypothetical protein
MYVNFMAARVLAQKLKKVKIVFERRTGSTAKKLKRPERGVV